MPVFRSTPPFIYLARTLVHKIEIPRCPPCRECSHRHLGINLQILLNRLTISLGIALLFEADSGVLKLRLKTSKELTVYIKGFLCYLWLFKGL